MKPLTRWAANRTALALATLATAAGCNSTPLNLRMAKGKVVLADGDIRVLERWQVQLRSVADPDLVAFGTIEDDGRFGLAFYDAKNTYHPGIREGEYEVRFVPPRYNPETPEVKVDPKTASRLPARYQKFETSGVRCTITAGQEDTLKFDVEAKGS